MTKIYFDAELALSDKRTGRTEYASVEINGTTITEANEFVKKHITKRNDGELIRAKYSFAGLNQYFREYREVDGDGIVKEMSWSEYARRMIIPNYASYSKCISGVRYTDVVIGAVRLTKETMTEDLMKMINNSFSESVKTAVWVSKGINSPRYRVVEEVKTRNGDYLIPISEWIKGVKHDLGFPEPYQYLGTKNIVVKEGEELVFYSQRTEHKELKDWNFLSTGE